MLLRLALTSNVRGRLVVPVVSDARPASQRPTSAGEHPVEQLALELERAGGM